MFVVKLTVSAIVRTLYLELKFTVLPIFIK